MASPSTPARLTPEVRCPRPAARALVLHGGGSAGNAWEIGVIAGLFEAGLDVTGADLLIGTSAGSTAAAQITSGTQPTELLAAILDAAPRPRTGPLAYDAGRVPMAPVADHMERTNRIIAAAHNAADMRRRMGAAALELISASDGSGPARWRATVAARLPSQRWPERRMLITAVDAQTGEAVVFDRHSGVDLVDAVAASTANGFGVPPYSIGDTATSTAAIDATRMPIWPPDANGYWCCHPSAADHGIRWRGACTLPHRSTNCVQAAVESRPFSRTAMPATRSATT